MKLRLVQEGFAAYNGQMGALMFQGGVSTTDVLPSDAVRMSAVMLCAWEDGSSPSVAQSILDNADTPAPTIEGGAAQHDREAGVKPDDAPSASLSRAWTAAELAAIADKDGIKGLRKVTEPAGVKGNSIKELIANMLSATALH
jgi:hypothetical protein